MKLLLFGYNKFSTYLNDWIATASNYGHNGSLRVSHYDGWRGVAIGIVLISHFAFIPDWFPFERAFIGRLGVDFFFVLSGVLMANILFVKRTPLKTFYKRRASRILPVFVLFVSVVYGVSWAQGSSDETGNYFYTLFFLRSYLPVTEDIWRTDLPISHIWSLNVEEHCYVILSLITLPLWLRKREFLVLGVLGLATMVIHYIYVRFPEITAGRFHVRTETAAGHLMLSAGYFMIRERFLPYIKSWMPLAAIVIGIACYSEFAVWYMSWVVAPFAFAFAVNHVDKLPSAFLSFLVFRPLQLLGFWSYSIYLWQHPFYKLGVQGNIQFPGSTIVYLALAIGTALFSFYFVENPLRRYINTRWQ